ncbi:MAG: hypothetical protein ACE37K_19020 [Planctomycetota bacterium]
MPVTSSDATNKGRAVRCDLRGVHAGFSLAGVGASGCFAHINGNLGDFPAPVVGGNATYDPPIPADPVLSGAVFFAQLVASSPATPLGLVTSNGFAGPLGL